MHATLSTLALLGAAALNGQVYAQSQTSNDMGPGAMMWPTDRPWTADADNIAPCGSPSGPGNRTDFPLNTAGGLVALVYQKESYNVQLGISYKDNPQSNDDFSVLITPERMADINPGHECVPIPNPPSDITAGSKATFQIKYMAQFDNPFNQTFYACADITYVAPTDFKTTIPCFNATLPKSGASTTSDTGTGGTSNPTGAASSAPVPVPSTGGDKGMSGGAIAGTVVGCVVGVALLGAVAFLWRRSQKLEHKLRQSRSMRGVAWEDQFKNNKSTAGSEPSIQMDNRNATSN